MTIDISHDPSTGQWTLSYKRHIFIALGLLLVASGFVTLSGPWWLPIVVELLGQAGVVEDDKYPWALAAAQIVPGFGLLAYKHFILDRDAAQIAADRKALEAAKLDFERVRYYLSNLVDDHSCRSSLNSEFAKVSTRFSAPEHKFQYPPTVLAYEAFAAAAIQLQNFVAVNFFVFPNVPPSDGDYRYCLAPHLNMDREMVIYDAAKVAEYDRLKVSLHELVSQTEDRLATWIGRMKKVGFV
ncbi:MAG: hypothetical protein U1D25_06385 [Hydrogenophaga sp.]|uniref:hypothetical protein n=1 Tax=Hydrogenophaga sp. TaxID=1904254 RepID=UPI002AB8437B|nr:hypothetical protein [Hydrogenophaga sp.]MDZ4187718.1 hypothetical protein [Hydrogenophaga sp.]